MSDEGAPAPRSARWLGPVTLALIVFMAIAVSLRYAPPRAKSVDAPAAEFSAARAKAIESRLLDGEAPHPTESAANAAVRERLVAELTALGLTPEIQDATGCRSPRGCLRVQNVIAIVPGKRPETKVLLAAHYDSVAAGPGASDDGVGVAALLEIARILKEEPPHESSIALLFDDGEEGGLFGAEAFVADHPRAREVRVAVNLEARGTTGPSVLFETNKDNAWLARLVARDLPRPVTSSLFYAIYKALPNDTDVTVFKRYGLQAANFAFLGGALRYHTPLDDLAHVDLGSSQHQGDHALAMARALADADLDHTPPGDAVWFDVLALRVVWWPEGLTPILAIAACLLLAIAIGLAIRRRALGRDALLFGLAATPSIVIGAALACGGLRGVLRVAGAVPSIWIASPTPTLVALSAAAISVGVFAASLFARRAGAWGLWAGTWIVWTAIAAGLAWAAPSVSFLFLVPSLVAGVGGVSAELLRDEKGGDLALASLPAIAAASVIWLPLVLLLYDAVGLVSGALLGVTTAVIVTTTCPILGAVSPRSRRALAIAAGGVALVGATLAALLPTSDAEHPLRVSSSVAMPRMDPSTLEESRSFRPHAILGA